LDKKKAAKLPALSETLIEPDPHDPEATLLELDEAWSFVLKKTNKAWIWIALCRKTRQVVASSLDGEAWFCRKTSGIVVISPLLLSCTSLPRKAKVLKLH
jgi:hypothetical protein